MNFNKIYLALPFVMLNSLSTVVSSDDQSTIKLVTDSSRNLTVQLENINGKTKVTNVATGELVTWLDGEQANDWTDETYKLMLDKEDMQKRLLSLTEASLTASKSKVKQAILTDTTRGLSVQLKNENGRTQIKDVTGQESVFYIDGELAGLLTNADYQQMLAIEEGEKKLILQASPEKFNSSRAYYSGSFNMRVAFSTASNPTPKPASSKLSANLTNVRMGMNATVSMQLCRDIAVWPDQCYAVRSKPMEAGYIESFSTTWSASFPAGNYYLNLSKTNNGDYATGSFAF
ncbi:MAG: hypothetical protein E6Q83_01815 [Thiothrix sp.]|nr:MAG: hypothetical protein E6Q83_01815 [Thiothrix sp.]